VSKARIDAQGRRFDAEGRRVYDKAGKNYTGVVVGDGDFSVTYPSEGKGTVLRYGNILINLDRQ
jgi:hypothetical protein